MKKKAIQNVILRTLKLHPHPLKPLWMQDAKLFLDLKM